MYKFSGKDVRLKCRVKLGDGAGVNVTFHGPNNGADRVNPDQGDINLRRSGVRITANNEFALFDEYYTHPDAEALKKADVKHTASKQILVKTPLAVNEWHDLMIEMRGKEFAIWSDGKQVKSYQTHSGDEPKQSFHLSVGNESKKQTVDAWFDDVFFEILR